TSNIAADHNQLTMALMKRIARKHNMVCLLHEKPFAGVTGSGKHNNWSMSTNTGVNLLEPGETPAENAQFLLFLCSVIQAVDDYQDLLRLSVASAGNDHRLGVLEAPPAIISIFLGDELEGILDAICHDRPYGGVEKESIKVGVHVLPKFPKDTTDRNRTSPFAFTGNKFEFRMLGANLSVSSPNVFLNTAVAESLRQYADILEGAEDFESALHDLIKSVIEKHRRIIFNGNGYGKEWEEEAERRGLLNLRTTPDCTPYYLHPKNIELFARHKVYSETELHARYEVKLDKYCKVLHIEALTMLDMLRKDILPAVSAFSGELAESANRKKALCSELDISYELELTKKLSRLIAEAASQAKKLEDAIGEDKLPSDSLENAKYHRDVILSTMNALRAAVDEMEMCCDAKRWPYPSYGDLLFSVK
ncbi:MAG: glutamine synthetase type III, partial [Oscillospiraceae bacterium]|nr:glutamine synthetase type III [Oscillospiraceae bacterium]